VLLFFGGLRLIRADHAAVLSYIEPVAAVVFAALFLAEPISWYTIAGGGAVIAGGVMVTRLAVAPSPEAPALPLPVTGNPLLPVPPHTPNADPRKEGPKT
jgi:hypothetical protein